MTSDSAPKKASSPKRIFIVPYRGRHQQKFFFEKHMSFLLEDEDDYEIYFAHQCDKRSFNRGAMKNIGFLAAKARYPESYRDIDFIFNDVDTMPFHKLFDYKTTPGVVKHYYGFTHCLGGIVVIRGGDFERIGGFPNPWSWGAEDNALQIRCTAGGLVIDRSQFYPIGSPQMLQLFDGVSRIISKKEQRAVMHDTGRDGLGSITQLVYTVDPVSASVEDNVFVLHDSKRTFYINATHFLTAVAHDSVDFYHYDLREPTSRLINPDWTRRVPGKNTTVAVQDWTHIPDLGRGPGPVPMKRPMSDAAYKYSPEYARINRVKARATPTVKISLGGLRT